MRCGPRPATFKGMKHTTNIQQAIRVLGLAGSPRRGGKAERLLDSFLDGAREAGAEVDKVDLTEIDIQVDTCSGCAECATEGKGDYDPDVVRVCEKVAGADVVALASPVFVEDINPRVFNVLSRCEAIGSQTPLADANGHTAGRGVVFTVDSGLRNAAAGRLDQSVRPLFESLRKDLSGPLVFARDGMLDEEARRRDERYAMDLGERFAEDPDFFIHRV